MKGQKNTSKNKSKDKNKNKYKNDEERSKPSSMGARVCKGIIGSAA
jgi:hypothetical protein